MRGKILIAVAACAVCLCACGTDRYGALDGMLDARYSEIELTVTETFGDASLESVFVLTDAGEGKRIAYTVERFAALDPDGAPAEDGKEVLEGAAVFRGGMLVSSEGDEIGLPHVLGEGLSFRKEYFSGASFGKGTMRADVTDPSGFLGVQTECTQMRVEAEYGEVFGSISIHYRSALGSAVVWEYIFTP